MTVIELLGLDVKKIRCIRLPIAEQQAANALAEIANEIEVCVQVLKDGAAAIEGKAQTENAENSPDGSREEGQDENEDSKEDLFGEKENDMSKEPADRKAGDGE